MQYGKFNDDIRTTRESAEKVYFYSNDVDKIKCEILSELNFYASLIPDFFSYNREAKQIKDMYEKLKSLDYSRNKVINCIDVPRAGCLYKEYFDGMVEFINKYLNSVDDRDTLQNQLITAIKCDPLFIDSLFGGKNNEPANEELTEAVKNVEYFVDYLDMITYMRKNIACICDRCHDDAHINVLRLIANSVGIFSSKVVYTILETYCDIIYNLEAPTQMSVKSSGELKVF